MAITTNLLQGKLRADLEKKLDPMKIGMLALLVIGVGVAMFFMLKQAEVSGIKADVRDLTAKHNKLKPEQARMALLRAKDDPRLAAIDALTTRLNNRFFWAPTLEAIMKVTPENVQLNNFQGDINDKGDVSISIDCAAASEEPRTDAENFRTRLISHFRNVDPAADAQFPLMVDSALPLEVGGKKVPTVQFSITLKYKTQQTGAAEAPAAVAAPAPAPAPAEGAEP